MWWGFGTKSSPEVSVIIPCLNEESSIARSVESGRVQNSEVIVVDGGSRDASKRNAKRAKARVISSAPGRGCQMNAGAAHSKGEILLFLHADTVLPPNWLGQVRKCVRNGAEWGCFGTINIKKDVHPISAYLVETAVALRTRLLKLPYGDQGIFVKRAIFGEVGGYPAWRLLEDVKIVQKLNSDHGAPAIIPSPISTSGRRWNALGLFKTTCINQAILAGYWLGIDINTLANIYTHYRK